MPIGQQMLNNAKVIKRLSQLINPQNPPTLADIKVAHYDKDTGFGDGSVVLYVEIFFITTKVHHLMITLERDPISRDNKIVLELDKGDE